LGNFDEIPQKTHGFDGNKTPWNFVENSFATTNGKKAFQSRGASPRKHCHGNAFTWKLYF
jgi:hypothetical protein